MTAIVVVLAACGGESSREDPTPTTAAPTTATPTTTVPPTDEESDPGGLGPSPDGFPEGESALDDMTASSFPDPLVPPGEIISGGPPPDGIPPLDAPSFVGVETADIWLKDAEPVVVLDIDGDARAYPVQILMWHEIVNDTVSGVPVSVTYCPLCNSAMTYVREVDGHETTFGTSGRLFASALVMYDRATESLWTHFDGRAVVGVLTGHQLEPVASPLLAWADFKAAHPEGQVLDRETTGHSRPYGNNPYGGYDNPEGFPFLFRGDVDARSTAMQRVVGVRSEEAARAWTLEAISDGEAAATNSEVGEVPVVIFWKSGQNSALDSGDIDEGRDVGSVGVFSPTVDGQDLTFVAEGDTFVDEQTNSIWDIAGRATAGELEGSALERIPHLDTFWFAWSTYAHETDLIEA